MNNWKYFLSVDQSWYVSWLSTLSTIKGREGALTLTLVRGEQRGDSGDTCWYPPPLIYVSSGDIVSDVSPLPQFLDNRVVLLPIWKLLCRCPGSAIADKCYCLWDQGRARGDFHCLTSKMFHVLTKTLNKIWKNLFPFPTLLLRRQNKKKDCFFFSFFVCIPSFVFMRSDLPGSILMCL